MTVGMLIRDIVPPLLPTDTCQRALAWMEEFRLRYLPVIRDSKLLGVLSEVDLLTVKNRSTTIGEAKLPLDQVFVMYDQHVYDALQFVTSHNYTVVPVLDDEQRYAGLVTAMDLVRCFADFNAVHAEGGIIQLEVKSRDYMLSEIAQLVEANDASIISLSARPNIDHSITEITIKVNRVDLTRILAAFNRYDYKVTGHYHQSEFPEDMQERYDAFMKYLNT